MQGASGAYVYRVKENGEVEAVNVQTGITTADGWIIDEGLQPGDRVIVSGVMKMRPGMIVDPVLKARRRRLLSSKFYRYQEKNHVFKVFY